MKQRLKVLLKRRLVVYGLAAFAFLVVGVIGFYIGAVSHIPSTARNSLGNQLSPPISSTKTSTRSGSMKNYGTFSVYGVLRSVTTDSFTIQTSGGNTIDVSINEATNFIGRGSAQKMSMSQLKLGTQVAVFCRVDDSGQFNAIRVTVTM